MNDIGHYCNGQNENNDRHGSHNYSKIIFVQHKTACKIKDGRQYK